MPARVRRRPADRRGRLLFIGRNLFSFPMKSMRMFGPGPGRHGPSWVREAAAAPDGLLGFRAASSAAELQREKAFDAAIDPADLRSWLEQMSSEPNQVGSPHDKANADFILAKFKEWGWDARIETFDVLYPTPKSLSLELVAPVAYKARLSGARRRRRPDIGAHRRGASPLQRLLRGRGRHRGPRVRELRHARRLRRAREARHRRQGQDRDRALRRRLARTQAQARPGARRRRVHHLLRPARGRATGRATSIRRAATGRTTACSADRSRTSPCIPATR